MAARAPAAKTRWPAQWGAPARRSAARRGSRTAERAAGARRPRWAGRAPRGPARAAARSPPHRRRPCRQHRNPEPWPDTKTLWHLGRTQRQGTTEPACPPAHGLSPPSICPGAAPHNTNESVHAHAHARRCTPEGPVQLLAMGDQMLRGSMTGVDMGIAACRSHTVAGPAWSGATTRMCIFPPQLTAHAHLFVIITHGTHAHDYSLTPRRTHHGSST